MKVQMIATYRRFSKAQGVSQKYDYEIELGPVVDGRLVGGWPRFILVDEDGDRLPGTELFTSPFKAKAALAAIQGAMDNDAMLVV